MRCKKGKHRERGNSSTLTKEKQFRTRWCAMLSIATFRAFSFIAESEWEWKGEKYEEKYVFLFCVHLSSFYKFLLQTWKEKKYPRDDYEKMIRKKGKRFFLSHLFSWKFKLLFCSLACFMILIIYTQKLFYWLILVA